ncbi:MAG: hypothetical protein QW308_03925 [Candidatus Woesearchaeota archaeon]
MKKAKDILKHFEAPGVLFANCFFWGSCYKAKDRRSAEKYYQSQVYNWLQEINKRLQLNLDIEWQGNEIVASHNGEQVFWFSFAMSCRHVYKRQDVVKLAKLLQQAEQQPAVEAA